MSITDFPAEVLLNQMLFMNYSDLQAFCSSNPIFNRICSDDYFWKVKIEHDFGMLTQYKPENITHRQQYRDLLQAKYPDPAAADGRLDLLILLLTKNLRPDQNGVNVAAANGHLEVLKYLNSLGLRPNQNGVNSAAANGHLEVLKWLKSLDLVPN